MYVDRRNPEAGNNLTMVRAINQALAQELARDDKLILFGQDIGKNGGVFRTTEHFQEKFGEERVNDTPLAESGILGMAIGLANQGFHPVAEIQFLPFIYEALDSINQMSRMSYRTGGLAAMPIVVRTPFGGGVGTPEFHPDNLEGLLAHFQGLRVVMPSSAIEAKGLMAAAIQDPHPVVFLEHMYLYRSFREKVDEEPYTLPIAEARVVQEGEDVTVITYGAMVRKTQSVVEELEAEGIHVELIDLRSLAPIDYDTIMQSVLKTQRVVMVQEAQSHCGLGGQIISEISRRAFYQLLVPIEFVAAPNTPFPFKQLEHDWLPSEADIKKAIMKTQAR